ncbi:MAG: c-type cytochrome, partial [Advenella sp.]
MSDQTEHHEEHDEHVSPIKTPKQLIVVVVLAFILPVLIIILLVNVVSSSSSSGAGSDSLTEESVAARIAPVAKYNTAPVIVAAADAGPKKLKTGEEVYKSLCMGCHDTGVAGAPKFGDKA